MMNQTMADRVDQLKREAGLDNPPTSAEVAEIVRENRTLRWKLKSICKQNGRQGQTIHDLRNLVDALRHTADQRSIGDYRRLLARLRYVEAENRALRKQVDAMNDEPIEFVPTEVTI